MTLDQLSIGRRALVTGYRSISSLQVRLRELGLVKGTTVKVERLSPLGDPMEISVRGSRISIRKKDASYIEVSISSLLES